ncbi:MAG: tagaturonate reductase [Saprospiraceae bacterium]
MQLLNRQNANIPAAYPERILQFGGGNFLRGFADWMVDVLNNKTGAQLGIVVVKPTERGDYDEWRHQDGLFHVRTKGVRNGALVSETHLVKSISRIIHPYREWDTFLQSAENPELRFVISNTTETGLRVHPEDRRDDSPPGEFPAKLTLWLYRRFTHFKGDPGAGCVHIPCELLVRNGELLRDCILENAANWQLGADFETWISQHNIFCNTLVDRIIPGVPDESLEATWQELGFRDTMVTEAEPYHLWAIEAPESVRQALPFDKAGLQVVYTDDLEPFRIRKVRILNGAHTCMMPLGYLYGIETVREAVEHPLLGKYIRQLITEEILPTLGLPEDASVQFAADVLDRFRNPFLHHQLISIALNSVSKFKARLVPTLLGYVERYNTLPERVVLALAALVRFYKGDWNGVKIPLNDEALVQAFFEKIWAEFQQADPQYSALAGKVLRHAEFWGQDLSLVPGLTARLAFYLEKLHTHQPMEAVLPNSETA